MNKQHTEQADEKRTERGNRAIEWLRAAAVGCALGALASSAMGAGTLTPANSAKQPIEIVSHQANITINNGFAMTEVLQTFRNPNAEDLEAIYSCPLPRKASLSEMTIWAGEKELNGEVLTKEEADRIYNEEKAKGNDAGKAEKNGYQTFDFYVHPVRAQAETRVRYVYYQPLEIDTGIGRYLYPLESGGTDDMAQSFWTQNEEVSGEFNVNLVLKSAHPVVDVRAPGYENMAVIEQTNGVHRLTLKTTEASLNRDFVFYYRLADDLPGRVEVIPYRAGKDKPGSFMMLITPGLDLKPLTHGADYIYVLDTSGSMNGGKIHTLAKGVSKVLGKMNPQDRFRIVTFNSSASELTRGWTPATEANVREYIEKVSSIGSNGSTDLHAGLAKALSSLDNDRATSIVLVTDGVANTGVVDPKLFQKLLEQYDVRIFGFVMGNSANWPLMELISSVTGGFSAGVSNDDDIIGQIMLAKSKILHESLHNAEVKISGVKTFDTTDGYIGKIYRGQQLVLFGRYDQAGKARVRLKATLTGADTVYETEFDFPEIDLDNPEIERLWALNRIEEAKRMERAGLLPEAETRDIEKSLGVQYQLVTDETTMIVLTDEVYEQRGIERRNQQRVRIERSAQSARQQQPARNYTVDKSRSGRAPRLGGGGAVDGVTVLGILLLLGGHAFQRNIRRKRK